MRKIAYSVLHALKSDDIGNDLIQAAKRQSGKAAEQGAKARVKALPSLKKERTALDTSTVRNGLKFINAGCLVSFRYKEKVNTWDRVNEKIKSQQ